MIAQYIAKKFLPAGTPVFNRMSDAELLSIVGWAQEWPIERVYDTAFEQVFPEKQLTDAKPDFDEWFMVDNPKLPIIVREELIRAFRIHMATGRMDVLRLGAVLQRYAKRIMYVGLLLLFLFLVF
tara:strand:- start:21 stop:395 length:375 start_codon:yes stop_codon:yes gene_type:complete